MRQLVCVALFAYAIPSLGQESQPQALQGRVSLGIRSVDVGGADNKFREDVNLDDGARIFDLAVTYVPPAGSQELIDRLELSASNLGGDPFENIHFGAQKFGAYRLNIDRRKSDYFYEDTILPSALATVTASNSGDHHHFDFERIRDTADLDIDLSARTKLNLGLEHTTRIGNSTTTLDIVRDEFELDRPIDESMNEFNVGVQHAWDKITLIFDEQARDFANATDIFLPGASSGENTTDPSELFYFSVDQAYDFRSRGHSLRVLARPTQRTDIQAAWHRETLDLDLTAHEISSGIDFAGAPVATDINGQSAIARDIDVHQIDASFDLTGRLRLTAAMTRRALDQNGSTLFGADQGLGRWDTDSTGFELGLALAVAESVVVSFGASAEDRDIDFSHDFEAELDENTSDTSRDGYFARLEYHGGQGLTLSASLEDNSIDDPFTLGSPTSSDRVKLSTRYDWRNGLGISASYRRSRLENDNSLWTADTDQGDLRLNFRTERVELSAGYSLVDLKRDIDQLVTGGTRQDLFGIHYAARARFLDSSVRWQLNDRIDLGGSLRTYDNDGSYPLARDDFRAFLALDLGASYLAQIVYRNVDYVEDTFDDYDADIVELQFGLRW